MTALQPADRVLDEVARADPVAARLASLQAVALRASEDPRWREGLTEPDGAPPAPGLPMLHERTLAVDPRLIRELLRELASAAVRSGAVDARPLATAARAGT